MNPSTRPELPLVRIGYIPLADCASLVMACELGLDRRHGVRIELSREASWAAVRDKLAAGELQMAQLLYGLAYSMHLGLGGPQRAMAVLMGLNQNGQGITLSSELAAQGAHDAASLARLMATSSRRFTFAQTFPTGTHALWLYHWLASAGVHPFEGAHVVTVPPPRMGALMAAGQIDAFCAGEPWNHRALHDGVGVTVATSQQIWPDHPEKALACSADFAAQAPHTCLAVMRAVLEASRWIDASNANRERTAETLARPAYVNVPLATLLPRLQGAYEDGLGRSWQDPHALRFFGGGEVNFPWLSDGLWFLTQFKRWGLLRQHPAYEALAGAVQRVDLYRQAATAVNVPLPAEVKRSSRLLGGPVWNGRDPAGYADSFAIAARVAAAV